MAPTLANGKVCYLEIPATDVARSAEFYNKVFGWEMRQRGDGATAFDDGVEEVSGAFVMGRPPAAAPGLMVYIWVESAAATVDAIIGNGGEIVQAIGGDPGEITARFRDPGGNVMGIYQEPG
jgi:predicted enzyme related to lactoylglutathione lyase